MNIPINILLLSLSIYFTIISYKLVESQKKSVSMLMMIFYISTIVYIWLRLYNTNKIIDLWISIATSMVFGIYVFVYYIISSGDESVINKVAFITRTLYLLILLAIVIYINTNRKYTGSRKVYVPFVFSIILFGVKLSLYLNDKPNKDNNASNVSTYTDYLESNRENLHLLTESWPFLMFVMLFYLPPNLSKKPIETSIHYLMIIYIILITLHLEKLSFIFDR